MQEEFDKNQTHKFDDQIDLKEFFNILWHGKRIIISTTIFFSTLGVLASLYLPNIYESKAILTPNDTSGSISRSLQNYAGLAGLAGISIPSEAGKSNYMQAIQKLNSLSFFETNFLPTIFLPDLMAFESWDSNTNKHYYDGSIYDVTTNTWVRNYSYPYKAIPSAQESFDIFIAKHLSIDEDSKTGIITLKVKHQSPFIAKKWAEILVDQVNLFYRENDKSESEKAINYLNEQIAVTNYSEVKMAISQLLQEETKKLALIEANQSYIFEYIDPPAVMEKKSEPKRSLICILSALLGGLLSIIFVLIKNYVFRENTA